MQVIWAKTATDQLTALRHWLKTIEGANPRRTIERIAASGHLLERFGDIGRQGALAGTRELSVREAPYVIVYTEKDDHFLILGVFHMAKKR